MSIPESALNYGSILTLAGENAEINGKLNSKPINFTHIAIGDANDVYVQPSRTQTALVHELARIPITGMEKITPSKPDAVPQLKVWAKIPDDIVDIAVREFAAVATFDGTSYLHAVGNTVRIPILSGSNNGGEVNDIYIEMTFAVTSLDPIVMIDPTIVTATRKFVKDEDAKHLVAENPHPQYPLASAAQFLPYNPDRIYSLGEICYTKTDEGHIQYWEWYSNVESLAGKDPLDIDNRQTGWTDETKPFYWTPHKKARAGTPLWPWMSMTIPEGTLNVVGNSVPVAVFWRLATALPELVNVDTGMIDFPDARSEFFRVIDQSRGIDTGRKFGSVQLDSLQNHQHFFNDGYVDSFDSDLNDGRGPTAIAQENDLNGLNFKVGSVSNARHANETRPRNLAFPILIEV
ncbi:phage tail-collar fiber domain-containing protein [Vibrio cholerae]|uniref:phage tail-collar fiber domain-containing protein n=1 Tax=Vibrio cholerae TaxID=666 RepID=UPI000F0B526A|nr:phage tail protein [Vibrio cholerae]RNE61468.1 phage tail protein [Vibrio cholerae]GHY82717.1 phage tail protein [Vibrio cholerae]